MWKKHLKSKKWGKGISSPASLSSLLPLKLSFPLDEPNGKPGGHNPNRPPAGRQQDEEGHRRGARGKYHRSRLAAWSHGELFSHEQEYSSPHVLRCCPWCTNSAEHLCKGTRVYEPWPPLLGTGIPAVNTAWPWRRSEGSMGESDQRTTWGGRVSIKRLPSKVHHHRALAGVSLSLDAHLNHLGIFENYHKDPSPRSSNRTHLEWPGLIRKKVRGKAALGSLLSVERPPLMATCTSLCILIVQLFIITTSWS